MVSGALPALIFPSLGLATSFITMIKYHDYEACVMAEQLRTNGAYTTDKIKEAMRNYACWYYAFTISKTLMIIKAL